MFSAKDKVTKQIVIAVEDKNGQFMGYFGITTDDSDQGCIVSAVSDNGSLKHSLCSSTKPYNLTSGRFFNFTTTFSVTVDNTVFKHSVVTKISDWGNAKKIEQDSNARKWNFENVKLYIGGYKTTVAESSQFTGCVSDVFVNGTNVITTYFNQSPNHTNPTVHSGSLPENATECNYDIMTTTAPQSTSSGIATIPSTTAQTKSGATDMTSMSKAFITVCCIVCNVIILLANK